MGGTHLCRPTVGYSGTAATPLKATPRYLPFFLHQDTDPFSCGCLQGKYNNHTYLMTRDQL